MKSSLIIALLLFFVSCGKDENLRVIHNNDRVTDLERRVTLLEQIVQTKADAQALQNLSTFINSQLTQLLAELAVIQSDYLTSENADELIELVESAYQELLSKINDLRSRVTSLENDPRLDEVIQALEDLQYEVADIEPVINDNSVTYEVTEVVFNFGNLFTYIDNSVTNITQDSTDLTDILARLAALESNTFQAQIDDLESQLTALQSQVNALQSNSGGSSGLVFVAVTSRKNGNNNDASVKVKFKNISSVTISKFRVNIQASGGAEVRSGSSFPNGNVPDYGDDYVVFQHTSSGIAPNQEVEVTILMDNLTGNQTLNFTAEVL